jgi:predicted nucleic acid-binding protein
MPDKREIVINTGPIIALVAALGDLSLLRSLYQRLLVPYEVCQEILVGGPNGFAVNEFEEASWLQKWPDPLDIAPILINQLDIGEASVIQLALKEKIRMVCIDEPRGRRIARLSGLSLTGSIGILLRAKKEGHPLSIQSAIQRMQERGVWLSEQAVAFALKQAGEEEK